MRIIQIKTNCGDNPSTPEVQQESQKLRASLDYIGSLRSDPVSLKKKLFEADKENNIQIEKNIVSQGWQRKNSLIAQNCSSLL